MNFLNQYNAQIADLCRRYSVERLFAFGSVLTDRFNDESDVDFLAEALRQIAQIRDKITFVAGKYRCGSVN